MASPDGQAHEAEQFPALAPAGDENRSGVEGGDGGTPAQQETPEVSSGDTAPTLPAIASAAPVAVAEAAVAEAEEVQRAEIHIGEAQPEPVPTSRRGSELPPLRAPPGPPGPRPSRAQVARADARRRIVVAREELERRVAEATEARLRRQADQEETARRRAEEAQQRAKQRLQQRARKAERSPSPGSVSAPESQRSPRSPSPSRHAVSEALPGLKPAKARVRKKILKQRQEQELRLKEIEEDRERLELRKQAELEAAEVHRLEAAKRAAQRFRRERCARLKAEAEHEEEVRQARERQKFYRNPREIAKIIAEAQVQSQVQERRRSAQHEESHLRRERERARRVLDGEDESVAAARPFGGPASKTPGEFPEDPLLAKTVYALTDEDWKVNIKFS